METWFLILITACLAALLKAFLSLRQGRKCPPGPRGVPVISSILWLRKTSTEMEASLRSLRSRFGPIVTLPVGSRPVIFISSHSLAHQALIQNGAAFAERPEPPPTTKIISSNQHNISSAYYGPRWRLLRRNLTSQIVLPGKMKAYSHARKWVLGILITHLGGSGCDRPVRVVDHFQFAMFCLLVLMCFGDKLGEEQIREIERAQRKLMVSFTRFQILNFWPWLTRIVLRSRWDELFEVKRDKEEVLVPLIRARKQQQQQQQQQEKSEWVTSYVDTLLSLELEDGDDGSGGAKRRLSEEELVSACSEFLDAGTDTTSTALQWIMANLVKYPHIQERLYEEIRGVVGGEAEDVGEEELNEMPYLKAVVLEGLRRHPPGHFVLPHSVSKDVELGGYVVPKDAVVNFMVAEMSWDPEVWEDPMGFRPERFLSSEGGGEGAAEFDITGTREIKMMPFGAGRRICPGLGLAMLHLEYFVANLVWRFRWAAADGDEVDLSEKQEFTIVMKHPLHARLSPRRTT